MDLVLDALLSTRPTMDGRDDEFEELWEHAMTIRPKLATLPLGPIILANNGGPTTNATPADAGTITSRRMPKVGTLIQRSYQCPKAPGAIRSTATTTTTARTRSHPETPYQRPAHCKKRGGTKDNYRAFRWITLWPKRGRTRRTHHQATKENRTHHQATKENRTTI